MSFVSKQLSAAYTTYCSALVFIVAKKQINSGDNSGKPAAAKNPLLGTALKILTKVSTIF
jgi:hypothetical protein